MSDLLQSSELTIRPYRTEDQPAVLDLLRASLQAGPGGELSPEWFAWKHQRSPFGASFMLVAEVGGEMAGLRAFMRWQFQAGGRTLRAARAVDTATHPSYQGRGIFLRLTREALQALSEEVDLIFNTPNDKSLPGYLKLGWVPVGRLPVRLRIRRPMRFVAGLPSLKDAPATDEPQASVASETLEQVLGDSEALSELLERARPPGQRLTTLKDAGYLRWRYAGAPFLGYRAVHAERGGRLCGLAIFRVRPRGRLTEASVAELIVPQGDVRQAAGLLRRVVRAAPVDHLTCSMPQGTTGARAAIAAGFLPAPGGLRFVVKPLARDLAPDPTDLASWGLVLGDFEVF